VTAEYVTTQKQLEQALASARKRLPAYQGLLDFYGPVFEAVEVSHKNAAPAPVRLSSDRIEKTRQGGFPLVSPSEFFVDMDAAETLFHQIVSIARKTPGKWAAFAEAVSKTADASHATPTGFFENFLNQNDPFFADFAGRYGVDLRMLTLVVYNSVLPSLRRCAEQLAAYLDRETPWEKGFCPVCGNLPGLAVLEENGARAFFCSFCYHKWPSRRLFCPFCENTDSGSLQYFYSEAEDGYRVEVCDRCGKYIKSLDLRALSHPVYPPLELLTTLHLDMKAREAGYESAGAFVME